MISFAVSKRLERINGWVPVNASYSVTPRLHKSNASDGVSCFSASGERYAIVPTMWWERVK
jgi:hypothetical protein